MNYMFISLRIEFVPHLEHIFQCFDLFVSYWFDENRWIAFRMDDSRNIVEDCDQQSHYPSRWIQIERNRSIPSNEPVENVQVHRHRVHRHWDSVLVEYENDQLWSESSVDIEEERWNISQWFVAFRTFETWTWIIVRLLFLAGHLNPCRKSMFLNSNLSVIWTRYRVC